MRAFSYNFFSFQSGRSFALTSALFSSKGSSAFTSIWIVEHYIHSIVNKLITWTNVHSSSFIMSVETKMNLFLIQIQTPLLHVMHSGNEYFDEELDCPCSSLDRFQMSFLTWLYFRLFSSFWKTLNDLDPPDTYRISPVVFFFWGETE